MREVERSHLACTRPVIFLWEFEGRGGDQGESKNAALDLLQDLVVRAHRYKLSGYDRHVLTDDPLAPAVKRWWSRCCEGFVPVFWGDFCLGDRLALLHHVAATAAKQY